MAAIYKRISDFTLIWYRGFHLDVSPLLKTLQRIDDLLCIFQTFWPSRILDHQMSNKPFIKNRIQTMLSSQFLLKLMYKAHYTKNRNKGFLPDVLSVLSTVFQHNSLQSY